MKKYIKPAIEEVKLDVYTPIAQSPSNTEIRIDSGTVVIDPTGIDGDGVSGGDGNYGQWAPGKKGSNDEDFGW